MFNREHPMRRSILRDTMQSIRHNSLMSLASILSITAALIILGIFLVLTINIHQVAANIENGLKIQVFFNQDVTEEQKSSLKQALESNDLIQEVQYESKDQALKNFSESLEGYSDLMSSFNSKNNPMPESFIVKAKRTEDMDQIKSFIDGYKETNGIEYVKYGQDYIKALTNFNHFVNLLCIIVIIVLSIISFFLIYN